MKMTKSKFTSEQQNFPSISRNIAHIRLIKQYLT